MDGWQLTWRYAFVWPLWHFLCTYDALLRKKLSKVLIQFLAVKFIDSIDSNTGFGTDTRIQPYSEGSLRVASKTPKGGNKRTSKTYKLALLAKRGQQLWPQFHFLGSQF